MNNFSSDPCDSKFPSGAQLHDSVGAFEGGAFAHRVALQDGQRRPQLQEVPARRVVVPAQAALKAGARFTAEKKGCRD